MKKIIRPILVMVFISFIPWAFADQPVVLDDIVVTASRMAQRNYKVPANITVIDSQQIENSGAQNVSDILKEAVGVNIYDNSTAKSSVIDIRGFGDTASRNVLVLVNDRKVNNVDISGPDLVQIPLEAVERIEVVRGAGSVLYGDNAVGGVVNIITKKGKGDLKGRAGVSNGSYDARSVDMEVSGDKNHISYFGYSKYDDARGYRQNSDALTKDFNSRLGYDLSDKLSADVDVGWHEDNQRLPGGLTDSEIVALGRRGTANPDDYANTKDRYLKVGMDVKPWPEDIEWGKFSVDFDYRNRDVYDAFFSFGEFSTKRNIDTYGLTGKYVFDRQVFNKDVNFVTGVDYYDTSNDILGSGTNVDDISIFKKEIGVFGYAQYEALKDIYINAGTRYHQAEYEFHQRNVVVDQSQRPDVWSSTAGVRYDYAKGSNVHFNAQQTFRFLATDEWYSTANFPGFGITPGLNLNLDQQTGVQYETGIKHNFYDAVIVSVTPYQMDQHNEIFFDPVTFANSNYDQTRRRGVEVGQQTDLLKFFSAGPLDKLEFDSNYTYQDAEFLKGTFDENLIPLVPKHEANAILTVGFLKNYNVSFIGHYVGSRFAINDTANATSPVKPHCLMDTKLTYDRKYMEFYVALNNIFDEQYYSYISKSTFSNTKSYFPAPERNVTVGMSVKF
jgi:iron complex outermembrane receptor protein